MKFQNILFGAAYYDEYMPCDRIDTDMEMLRSAGMNTIRIAESTWSTMEPHEGVFDFTHLNRMLDKAEEYGMNVIIGTPTYAIPSWMVRKYPDVLAFTKNGPEIYGHRQNMDITHPGYRFHAERIIRKLMEQVAHRKCVIGYQIDNETRAYDTSGPGVQKAFVSYLKGKFPDINDFNKEFGLDYWSNRVNDWKDFPDVRGTINQSLDAEFRKFQRGLVTEFFNWQAGIINEYRRKNQFITHNFDYGWNGYSFGMQPEVNQYECAKVLDIAGTDIYHPSASELTGAEIAFGGSLMRSLKNNSNYLVMETQAQGNTGWLPYKGQLRLQAYSHISSGANSVMYWHWHSIHNAIESYWKGVLSHNLKPNAIYREAALIGSEFNRIGDHIKDLKKKNSVAIMVDNKSLTGLNEFPIDDDFRYNNVLRWICDALYKLNIEYDFVAQDNVTLKSVSTYKMLIIPAMYSADKSSINVIREYVAGGGHVIMTFRSCFSNEHLKIYHDDQPYMLTECFGMTYDGFTSDNTVKLARSSFDDEGTKVTHFMELLIPDTAEVLARYDHYAYNEYAAVTANNYNKGRAVYIGCHFDEKPLMKLLESELQLAGIPVPDVHFPLIIKTGTNNYMRKVIFYLNYSSESIKTSSEYDGTELLSGRKFLINETIEIEPWGLAIMEV